MRNVTGRLKVFRVLRSEVSDFLEKSPQSGRYALVSMSSHLSLVSCYVYATDTGVDIFLTGRKLLFIYNPQVDSEVSTYVHSIHPPHFISPCSLASPSPLSLLSPPCPPPSSPWHPPPIPSLLSLDPLPDLPLLPGLLHPSLPSPPWPPPPPPLPVLPPIPSLTSLPSSP